MKISVKVLFVLLFGFSAKAQQKITIEDAAKHEGDSVTICSKVFGGKYLSNAGVTLLNVGGKYPDALLTLVIKDAARPAFTNKPEEFYTDKEVCITGKISMFKGKPQIEVYNETAISVAK